MSATVVVTVVPPGENKLISVTESQRVPDHLAVPVVSGGRVQVLSDLQLSATATATSRLMPCGEQRGVAGEQCQRRNVHHHGHWLRPCRKLEHRRLLVFGHVSLRGLSARIDHLPTVNSATAGRPF